MKVIYGRPGTALLTAEDEGVEIFYASEMKHVWADGGSPMPIMIFSSSWFFQGRGF
jgi:hypothetical protein